MTKIVLYFVTGMLSMLAYFLLNYYDVLWIFTTPFLMIAMAATVLLLLTKA